MHVIQLSNDKQKETHRRVASRVEKCKVPVIFNNIAPHLIDLRVFGWLITWTRGAAKSVDVNRSAELQLPRSHSVEQPAVCSARRQSFTEHVLAAAEGLSDWTVMHTTRRRCGVL